MLMAQLMAQLIKCSLTSHSYQCDIIFFFLRPGAISELSLFLVQVLALRVFTKFFTFPPSTKHTTSTSNSISI